MADGPISMTSSPTWAAKEFTAAQAGVSYNPANWTSLSGSQPWSAEFVFSSRQLSYNDLASGDFASDLGLEVTYTYSPVPEPAGVLGSIALLGGGLFFRRRKLAA